MTPTIQPDDNVSSPLGDVGSELLAAAQNVVYDQQGVGMIRQALENTKRPEAIAPTVAMVAITLLSQMGPKLNELGDEEMWGKHGVVHVVLDSIFEVAKELGYKAPLSDLRQAYEIVEEQLGSKDDESDDDEGMEVDTPVDQGVAESAMPVRQPMMGGTMPEGTQ